MGCHGSCEGTNCNEDIEGIEGIACGLQSRRYVDMPWRVGTLRGDILLSPGILPRERMLSCGG